MRCNRVFCSLMRSWTSLTVFASHTFGIVRSALVALVASAPAVTTQLALVGLTPENAENLLEDATAPAAAATESTEKTEE